MTKSELIELATTMKNLTTKMYDGIYGLTKAIEEDNMDTSTSVVSDCIDMLIMNKRQRILAEHMKYYHIWFAQNDKRWKTRVPDFCGGKGSKLLARNTKEKLENSIIEHYESQLNPARTLLTIYAEWIESKKNETSLANASKLQSVWDRYYKNSDIVKKSLKDLTVGDIKNFLYKVLNERNLTQRQYKEFKSVINMMLDYSVTKEYVESNKAKQISSPTINKFRTETIKPIDEVIFSKEAQKVTIEKAMASFNKTQNTCYLAICINFQLGLRVGELAALKSTDIIGDTIKIEREEISSRIEGQDGKLHKNGTMVVPHTKTLCGNRVLPLTPEAKKILKLVLDFNAENKLTNSEGYIFLDKTGKRKTTNGINSALRRLNGKRNKKNGYDIVGCPSGNHAIRKTVISNLHNSMKFPDVVVRDFAGHKDIATTQRHYIHPTNPMTDYKDAIADALKAE